MSNRPNQASSSDDEIVLIFLVVAFAAACYFLLPIAKEFFLTLKLWQMQIIAFVIPIDYHVQLVQQLKNTPPANWSLDQIIVLGYQVNYYLLPLVLILVYMAYMAISHLLYENVRHNKNYTNNGRPDGGKSLLMQEKKVWRYLEPIAHLDLLKQDPDVGDWASARKPQEIAEKYQLIEKIENNLIIINKENARHYFSNQLGDLYTDLDDLSIANKALVGIFSAFYLDNKLESNLALLDISASFGLEAKGKHDFSSGLALFEKYKDHPEINAIMKKHAYVTTALSALFTAAKSKGVIVTQYFIWLKPMNRTLYYALNNVGRQVSFTECAGVFDHYQHETKLGRPMVKVFVDEAVRGLSDALKNVKILEPEKLKSKK